MNGFQRIVLTIAGFLLLKLIFKGYFCAYNDFQMLTIAALITGSGAVMSAVSSLPAYFLLQTGKAARKAVQEVTR